MLLRSDELDPPAGRSGVRQTRDWTTERPMKTVSSMFPDARIPYGTWGSSYFPAWQTSALAEVNIGQCAGEAMGRILGLRKVPKSALDYLVIGSTIPWHWK